MHTLRNADTIATNLAETLRQLVDAYDTGAQLPQWAQPFFMCAKNALADYDYTQLGNPVSAGWLRKPLLGAAPAAVPAGHLIVPVEPTDDMLRSALQYDSIQDPDDPDSNADAVRADWSLMLAAAPPLHRNALRYSYCFD